MIGTSNKILRQASEFMAEDPPPVRRVFRPEVMVFCKDCGERKLNSPDCDNQVTVVVVEEEKRI